MAKNTTLKQSPIDAIRWHMLVQHHGIGTTAPLFNKYMHLTGSFAQERLLSTRRVGRRFAKVTVSAWAGITSPAVVSLEGSCYLRYVGR
jgi:hypothetical protein